MAYQNPRLGETRDIVCCEITKAENVTYTISGVLATIKTSDGLTTIRDAVTASASGDRAYFLESFTTGNGYVAGTEYKGHLQVTITYGSETHVLEHEDKFEVLSTIKE